MAIRFVILEADNASDYAEFQKALDKVSVRGESAVILPPAPSPAPEQLPAPIVPNVVVDQPQPQQPQSAAADLAALVAQHNGSAPVAQPQAQPARRGKRTDGLGMIGHAPDCNCPADRSIRDQLTKLFGQIVTHVPAEGTPEAASWAAALARSHGVQPQAVAQPAPQPQPQAAPAGQQGVPTPAAAGLAALQQAQQPQAQQTSDQPQLPEFIGEYPTFVYNVVLNWSLNLAAANKQEAMLSFLKGGRTLSSLSEVPHKERTLYDQVVGLIRKAYQQQQA